MVGLDDAVPDELRNDGRKGGRLLRQAFKLRCELDAPFGDDDELLVAWRQRGDSVGWPLHDWNPNILQGASQV